MRLRSGWIERERGRRVDMSMFTIRRAPHRALFLIPNSNVQFTLVFSSVRTKKIDCDITCSGSLV